MAEVYLGLGSNVGDRADNINTAVNRLRHVCKDIKQAPVYETSPLDHLQQPDFLNTVLFGKTWLEPLIFLHKILEIEIACGRDREKAIPKGPRVIDIDILLWDDLIIDSKEQNMLSVPHPSMHKRLFVLRPLLDINPNIADPRDGILFRDKAIKIQSQLVKEIRL